MNYSEVKELLAAGFTADEIRGFMSNPQNPQTYTQPEQLPETEPQPETLPDPEPQPESAPAPEDERFNQLNSTMEKLIKTIQQSNLQNARMDSPSTDDINKQVDSIMSSIIRPEHKEKEAH